MGKGWGRVGGVVVREGQREGELVAVHRQPEQGKLGVELGLGLGLGVGVGLGVGLGLGSGLGLGVGVG